MLFSLRENMSRVLPNWMKTMFRPDQMIEIPNDVDPEIVKTMLQRELQQLQSRLTCSSFRLSDLDHVLFLQHKSLDIKNINLEMITHLCAIFPDKQRRIKLLYHLHTSIKKTTSPQPMDRNFFKSRYILEYRKDRYILNPVPNVLFPEGHLGDHYFHPCLKSICDYQHLQDITSHVSFDVQHVQCNCTDPHSTYDHTWELVHNPDLDVALDRGDFDRMKIMLTPEQNDAFQRLIGNMRYTPVCNINSRSVKNFVAVDVSMKVPLPVYSISGCGGFGKTFILRNFMRSMKSHFLLVTPHESLRSWSDIENYSIISSDEQLYDLNQSKSHIVSDIVFLHHHDKFHSYDYLIVDNLHTIRTLPVIKTIATKSILLSYDLGDRSSISVTSSVANNISRILNVSNLDLLIEKLKQNTVVVTNRYIDKVDFVPTPIDFDQCDYVIESLLSKGHNTTTPKTFIKALQTYESHLERVMNFDVLETYVKNKLKLCRNPSTRGQLEFMQTTVGKLKSRSGDLTCPICYEKEYTQNYIFPCGHHVCMECFLSNMKRCPSCRHPLTSKSQPILLNKDMPPLFHGNEKNKFLVDFLACTDGKSAILCDDAFHAKSIADYLYHAGVSYILVKGSLYNKLDLIDRFHHNLHRCLIIDIMSPDLKNCRYNVENVITMHPLFEKDHQQVIWLHDFVKSRFGNIHDIPKFYTFFYKNTIEELLFFYNETHEFELVDVLDKEKIVGLLDRHNRKSTIDNDLIQRLVKRRRIQ